jgi:DNA-binding HxlR family transcriptional regulator
MDSLLRLLMGPWTTYVLWVLSTNGPTRFGELKRRVPGVSAKVLTDRLRMLVDAGVIYRRYEPTIPPRVTYGLAERGEELRDILDSLNAVALRWRASDEARPDGARLAAIVAAAAGKPDGRDRAAEEDEADLPRPAERIRRAAV